jgi:hypothetical protein
MHGEDSLIDRQRLVIMGKKKKFVKKPTHLFIPDTQIHAGVDIDHLRALGNYIVAKKPDTIIHIGDHADMPSLSTYEKKGNKYFHDKSYKSDVDSAVEAMEALLTPLWKYNAAQRRNKKTVYKPRMVMTLGNHEERINRAIKADPILEGTISVDDLKYKEMGWEVYDYLDIIEVDGIYYSHFFVNPDSMMASPVGGTIDTKLKALAHSFSMGHQQKRQYGTRFTANGTELHGLVCGSFYMHDEDYLGPQKNRQYWRGVVMKNEVENGMYDPCFISLDYLIRRWL